MTASTGAARRLSDVDWDFVDAPPGRTTHALHPYPAKFISQIPAELISQLSSPGERVVDVFCGSGTTLVEALRLGRHAIGVDAGPLACLIAEAKTTYLSPGQGDVLRDLASRAQAMAARISSQESERLPHGRPFCSDAPRPPDSARLEFWFDPFIVEELAEILKWCREIDSIESSTVALVAFSSIVVAVSKQDSDTRYVRREKRLARGHAFRRFHRALMEATDAVAEFSSLVDRALTRRVVQADVLARPDIGEVDLVVCSPPYPNAYSYHLYHRTRMLWLGMDQARFKREEIGSHRKYSAKGAAAANEETFRAEMSDVFGWLANHLVADGHACFVVGNSTLNGRVIDNACLLAEAATANGFVEIERIGRTLRSTRKAFNPVIGKIRKETILVLRKA